MRPVLSRTAAAAVAILAVSGAVSSTAPAIAAPHAQPQSCSARPLSDFAGTYTGELEEQEDFEIVDPSLTLHGLDNDQAGASPQAPVAEPVKKEGKKQPITLTISGTSATYTLPGQEPRTVSAEKSTNVEYWWVYFSGAYLNKAAARSCDSDGHVTTLNLLTTGNMEGVLTRTA